MTPAAGEREEPRELPHFRVAVIIVHYRTPELVLGALDSLVGELDPALDCAVVVDNASGDGFAEGLCERLAERAEPWVQLIRAVDNGGFSAGNNLGLASVAADSYLLLNSDAYLRPGALAQLLEAAAAEPGAALLAPRLEWPSGEAQVSCFRFPTPASELIDAAATGPVTRMLAGRDVPLPVSEARSRPEWASFACILLRASALAALGPMDEGYFLFYEDVDYCRRAWRGGWSVLHVPEARAVHLRGGSSPVKRALAARRRLPAYYYAARARYFRKWHGGSGLIRANLAWLLGRGISLLRESLGGKAPHLPERAWLDIWQRGASQRPGLGSPEQRRVAA